MKKRALILLNLLFLFISDIANCQITFQRTFGDNIWEYAEYMQQTADSGFIITGSKPPYLGADLDVYLLKIDNIGNVLWNKTYGGSGSDGGKHVQETADGGFVIAGSTGSYGMGPSDAFLLKTDSVGNLQWSKVIGASQYDWVSAVRQLNDGGFVFAGNLDLSNYKVFLIKTNANGDTIWTKAITIGNSNYVTINSMELTSDGGYILAGTSDLSSQKVCLVKTDSIGNPQWLKTYGGSGQEWGGDVQNTFDGGFVITGRTYFGAGNGDVYLIKTNSIGDTLWTKAYGTPNHELGLSVQQTIDGGYIVSGVTTPAIGDDDIYLIKTDPNGDTLWTKTIFLPGSSSGGYKILEAFDGGYYIGSDGDNFVLGSSFDFLLIKTDSLGNSGCNTGYVSTTVTLPPTIVTSPSMTSTSGGIIIIPTVFTGSDNLVTTTHCINSTTSEIFDPEKLFNIYPNPSNGIFKISSTIIKKFNIVIYNIFGEIVYSELAENMEANLSKQISLDLAVGIYIIKIFDEEKCYCRKLIIEHY